MPGITDDPSLGALGEVQFRVIPWDKPTLRIAYIVGSDGIRTKVERYRSGETIGVASWDIGIPQLTPDRVVWMPWQECLSAALMSTVELRHRLGEVVPATTSPDHDPAEALIS